RLAADGAPIGIAARQAGLAESRRQEHGLAGWPKQAGLRRRDGLGRPGAGGRDDQGEQRGAAHESSRQGNGGTRKLRAGEARGEPPPQCTVIVAWPVLPSLVARKKALPTARGWTSASVPEPLTLMTEGSLVDQETVRFRSKLPAASRRSARKNLALSPTARVAVSGTTVTVATGAAAATLMLASPVFPSLVARSEASPAAWARIVAEEPLALVIITTELSVLDHDTDRLLRILPAASRSCAVKVALSPLVRVALPRSEEHTSELQSPYDLVCRLL